MLQAFLLARPNQPPVVEFDLHNVSTWILLFHETKLKNAFETILKEMYERLLMESNPPPYYLLTVLERSFCLFVQQQSTAGMLLLLWNITDNAVLPRYKIKSFTARFFASETPSFILKEFNTSPNDPLDSLQYDLKDTVKIMEHNVDQLLQRGEKLEDVIKKSEHLSEESKRFYTTTRKLNRCCELQ